MVATHANGMYSTHINSIHDLAITTRDISAFDTDLKLTAYPNPVAQSTATIEFNLNEKSKVNLQIWDEYGRIIETLINEQLPEGKHRIEFDRKNLSPGIYYYSLFVNNRRKTNKLIIIK